MKPLIFSHYASPVFVSTIAEKVNGDIAQFESREFPDGESYLRIDHDCHGRNVIVLANLHIPNAKILPLVFLCETLRELGVDSISLVAPYLPYMRQDKQFQPGECVTSRYFAKLLSQHIDHLITIDPHLHRYNSLDEIYTARSTVLQADLAIAKWIKARIEQALIIGPDSESEQWAASVAAMVNCPYIILQKQRLGDREVQVSPPQANQYKDRTPVLIDDIISTGKTMIKTAEALQSEGLSTPVCIGVHALFSEQAYREMQQAGIKEIITCNTIPHESNQIDTSRLLSDAILNAAKNQGASD